MKSKKILAMVVAFAAFMATATSGLAAISTTTTYDFSTKKVSIVAHVPADADSEVTYLVKNVGGDIVYIDQQTAGSDGADFSYKIDINKISNLSTDIQYGTNGTAIDEEEAQGIELAKGVVVSNGNVKPVTYSTDANGSVVVSEDNAILTNGTELYVNIEAEDGYEVKSVKIGDTTHEGPGCYPVLYGQSVEVVTEETKVDVAVDSAVSGNDIKFDNGSDANADVIEKEAAAGKVVTTKLIKVTGKPADVGVKVNDTKYPAYTAIDETGKGIQDYTLNGVYAVRIITDSEVTVTAYAE